jgi:hypothetical protein
MKKILCAGMALMVVSSALLAQQPNTTVVKPQSDKDSMKLVPPPPPKKQTVADKTKGQKKNEGLFTLYQDTATGSLQMYIRKDQLGKEFIYESFSINGPNALFLNQSMHRTNLVFKITKAFDKLEFDIVNTGLYYDKNNPVSKTAETDKPTAVFFNDKYSLEDSLGYLISADQLFLSEKLDPV